MGNDLFDGVERRKYTRLESVLPIRVKLPGEWENDICSAVTDNVSHGGVCIRFDRYSDGLLEKMDSSKGSEKTHLKLAMGFDGKEVPVDAEWIDAKVEWAQKIDTDGPAILIGVVFTKLPEKVRTRIHEHVLGQFVKNYGKYN